MINLTQLDRVGRRITEWLKTATDPDRIDQLLRRKDKINRMKAMYLKQQMQKKKPA